MKQLIAGIILIVVLALGAFFYRNVVEQPSAHVPNGEACTEEAKICPDGSSVGRTGPACSFAPCAYPNVEDGDAGLAFAVPAGYSVDQNASGANLEFRGAFVKSTGSSVPHTIMYWKYPIPAGKTAEDVMIEKTRFSPSDLPAESINEFTLTTINGKTFYTVVIERFEAQVQTTYYFPRDTDVIRFDIYERDVTEWMNPDLVVQDLPEHKALQYLLGTLQSK